MTTPPADADGYKLKIKCESEHAACVKLRSPFMCDLRLAYCMDDGKDQTEDPRARPARSRISPLLEEETVPPSRSLRRLDAGEDALK